jgi:hypothetical protein
MAAADFADCAPQISLHFAQVEAHVAWHGFFYEGSCVGSKFSAAIDSWRSGMSVALAALLMAAAAGLPEVDNPGFEQISDQTGAPEGWSFTSLPVKPDLVRYAAATPAVGRESRALVITLAANQPAQTVAYNAHQDVTGFVVGKTYRVSANVQTKGLRTLPMIVVQCLDGSGKQCLAFARSPERKLDGDLDQWERVQTDVTVPEGTSIFRLRIGIPSDGNAGGLALIDDISITEAE